VTGNPSRAYPSAGPHSWANDRVPNRSSSSNHPFTAPGTVTECGPKIGIVSEPEAARTASSVAADGERPAER
jgi:hypothetical protein